MISKRPKIQNNVKIEEKVHSSSIYFIQKVPRSASNEDTTGSFDVFFYQFPTKPRCRLQILKNQGFLRFWDLAQKCPQRSCGISQNFALAIFRDPSSHIQKLQVLNDFNLQDVLVLFVICFKSIIFFCFGIISPEMSPKVEPFISQNLV